MDSNKRITVENEYIGKMTELQRRWGNPIDDDWGFVKEMSDDILLKNLKNTKGQLNFEKTLNVFKYIFLTSVIGFIVLGVIGLLTFGIKQIF